MNKQFFSIILLVSSVSSIYSMEPMDFRKDENAQQHNQELSRSSSPVSKKNIVIVPGQSNTQDTPNELSKTDKTLKKGCLSNFNHSHLGVAVTTAAVTTAAVLAFQKYK